MNHYSHSNELSPVSVLRRRASLHPNTTGGSFPFLSPKLAGAMTPTGWSAALASSARLFLVREFPGGGIFIFPTARRQRLKYQVQRMLEHGESSNNIARTTGLHVRTIRRYAAELRKESKQC